MIKKIQVLAAMLFLGTVCYSQVQLQPTLPVSGLVPKDQLWNLIIINGSGGTISGRINLVLLDRNTSLELVSATTSVFQVPNGPVVVQVANLNPIQYNYMGGQFDQRPGGLLPVGSYTACYSFSKMVGADKGEQMVEECVSFDVEPLSPPMLTFPADSSRLEIQPAQFSWIPPSPDGLFRQLHYEVLITEVQEGQKASEALQENMPFYSSDNAALNFLAYSGAQPAFEKDKWYAWQVTARDESAYAGKSEAWVFRISSPVVPEQKLKGVSYTGLKMSGAGKTVARDGWLRFSYFNQLADSVVKVTVADLSQRDQAVMQFEQKVVRGENFIQKNIDKEVGLLEGRTYILILENSAHERWVVLFETKKY